METSLLRSFLAVAEARSFASAARAVHLTQPTLSRQIARLEAQLGVPLFERYARHVECTVSGELLVPLARAIVNRCDEAVSLIRQQAADGSCTIRCGGVGNVFTLLLAPILDSFHAAYPNVTVDLIEKDDADLEEAVTAGELDCGIITRWRETRAASQYLLTEEILLVVAEGHRLADQPTIRLPMLAGESLMLPRVSMNAGNILTDALRAAGVEPKVSYRSNYPALKKELVRRGFGVATFPKLLLAPETLEGLVAIPFEPQLTRELRLIYPRDRPLPAATRALMIHIRNGVARRSYLPASSPRAVCSKR